MEPVEGTRTFRTTGAAYDAFMGRYSGALAVAFADHLGVAPGQRALDVGCGPGALTRVLSDRLGSSAVSACDPTPSFVADCISRNPGVDVRAGRAEQIPFPDDHFDLAASQLVLHFVSEPLTAAAEMRRVVRPGSTIAASVWDFELGMEMLRAFWDAALDLDPDAPDEARTLRFGKAGEIAELFAEAGLTDIAETSLEVGTTYADFDELWSGFLAGIGPAGAYCTSLSEHRQALLKNALHQRLGSPTAAFSLSAVARTATGLSAT